MWVISRCGQGRERFESQSFTSGFGRAGAGSPNGGQGMNGVWQKAGDRIRDALGQVAYETWMGPLTFVGLHDKTATIEAPNRFFREWVNDRYLDLIRQTISAEVGEPVEIKLTLGQDSNGDGHGSGHAKTSGNGATPAPLAEPERRGLHPH